MPGRRRRRAPGSAPPCPPPSGGSGSFAERPPRQRTDDAARARASAKLRQPGAEVRLDRGCRRLPGEVAELVGIAAKVVELGLAVVVADVDPAPGADRRVLTLIGLDLGEDAAPGR